MSVLHYLLSDYTPHRLDVKHMVNASTFYTVEKRRNACCTVQLECLCLSVVLVCSSLTRKSSRFPLS